MSPELQNYYSTNYSNCNLSHNWLATWQGVAYPSHAIQIIASPIQIFTFYIIWAKTPRTMKNMKLPLLVNHFWCTWFDLMLCTLSTPDVFLPTTVFSGVGILSSLEIPFTPQLATGQFSALFLCSSYVYLFESRSSALPQNRFRMTRKVSRICYHSLLLSINLAILISMNYFSTAEESEKLEALKIYPCPTKEFFEFPVTIFIPDPEFRQFFLKFLFPGFGIHSFGNLGFHVACTVYYLFLASPKTTIASGTRQAQRTFFIGIIFQTAIPVFPGACSWLLVLVFTENYRQELMNLTVIFFGLNGLAESLLILSIHHPFRIAVKQLFGFGKYRGLLVFFL
ncbi:LOW QUALITY PROTEIN: Protein CBR-SRH-95, partial [Caenorhabditis briggsae]